MKTQKCSAVRRNSTDFFPGLSAALLFIFGFGASAVFGTYAGEMADKYGRRLSCYVYCITYIVSCLTKHSPNFYVLLFGRLTGGVATSILFSSFESWLVAEHNKNFYPAEWLNQTLSLATLLNGVTAIAAGSLGALVRNHFDSLVAPFDLAIVFLLVAMAVISSMWAENKGEVSLTSGGGGSSGRSKFSEAIQVMQADHKVVLLGSIQSCFEAGLWLLLCSVGLGGCAWAWRQGIRNRDAIDFNTSNLAVLRYAPACVLCKTLAKPAFAQCTIHGASYCSTDICVSALTAEFSAMYIFVFMWTPKLEPLFTPLPHGQARMTRPQASKMPPCCSNLLASRHIAAYLARGDIAG